MIKPNSEQSGDGKPRVLQVLAAGSPGCLGNCHQPGSLDILAPGFLFAGINQEGQHNQRAPDMEIKMTQFEVKYFDTESWEAVSEKIVMENLLETFSLVTPVITEMMNGKYAYTPHGIYRMKLEGKELKD